MPPADQAGSSSDFCLRRSVCRGPAMHAAPIVTATASRGYAKEARGAVSSRRWLGSSAYLRATLDAAGQLFPHDCREGRRILTSREPAPGPGSRLPAKARHLRPDGRPPERRGSATGTAPMLARGLLTHAILLGMGSALARGWPAASDARREHWRKPTAGRAACTAEAI